MPGADRSHSNASGFGTATANAAPSASLLLQSLGRGYRQKVQAYLDVQQQGPPALPSASPP